MCLFTGPSGRRRGVRSCSIVVLFLLSQQLLLSRHPHFSIAAYISRKRKRGVYVFNQVDSEWCASMSVPGNKEGKQYERLWEGWWENEGKCIVLTKTFLRGTSRWMVLSAICQHYKKSGSLALQDVIAAWDKSSLSTLVNASDKDKVHYV